MPADSKELNLSRTNPASWPIHRQVVSRQWRRDLSREGAAQWGPWTPWSQCSRSCGGGVAVQRRQCVARPSDARTSRARRRRRMEGKAISQHAAESHSHAHPTNNCVGLYKRHHVCNAEGCPGPYRNFRAEQCTAFNTRPFKGQRHTWVPYLTALDPCALNCRAEGQGFYATLNKTVVDGTPCSHPIQIPKRRMPSTANAVCVEGQCKVVGCDGVIGSDRIPDRCGVCGGAGTSCRLVSGLFTMPRLSAGYSLVATIPRGACSLNITELRPTRNYLALRAVEGAYLLNGDYAVSWPGEVAGAGTTFHYQRGRADSGESITAQGPLTEPVDLMILYHQPNPGIQYQYLIPANSPSSPDNVYNSRPAPAPPLLVHRQGNELDAPIHDEVGATEVTVAKENNNKEALSPPIEPRHLDAGPYGTDVLGTESERPKKSRRRKFAWKFAGYGTCSKTCGGGVASPRFACVREITLHAVPERRCASLERPGVPPQRCGTTPCAAQWRPEQWGPCSATCGPAVRTRALHCMQEISPTITIRVNVGACLEAAPLAEERCQLDPCDLPDSVNSVTEPNVPFQEGTWPIPKPRVNHVTIRTTAVPDDDAEIPGTAWMHTEWTQKCSEECGTGIQTRVVLCANHDGTVQPDSECDANSKPDSTRACSSDKGCAGKWYSSPWSECTGQCGSQKQRREVVCIARIRGQTVIAINMTCPFAERPETERSCSILENCQPRWFNSEWQECSHACGTGTQKRSVACLDEHNRPAHECVDGIRPVTRRVCNVHRCAHSHHHYAKEHVPGSTESNMADDHVTVQRSSGNNGHGNDHTHVQDEPGGCIDSFQNCRLVVQARLCQYKFYLNACCASCRRTPPEA